MFFSTGTNFLKSSGAAQHLSKITEKSREVVTVAELKPISEISCLSYIKSDMHLISPYNIITEMTTNIKCLAV